MNPRPLTPVQRAALGALVSGGALRPAGLDLTKAQRFLDQAAEAIGEIGAVKSQGVRFDIAYNAAHDIGEAVLAAYGYRTGTGTGQHAAVGQALGVIFDAPPPADAVAKFDRFRLARNAQRYRAMPASRQEATDAAAAARELLAGAESQLGYGTATA